MGAAVVDCRTARRSRRFGFVIRTIAALLAPTTIVALSGCQVLPAVAPRHLIHPPQFLDLTGLLPQQDIDAIKVNWAVPRGWEALPLKKGPMYTHQQYRSKTGVTGVGVAHIHMPIPVSASAIAWFAKNEYLKRAKDQQDGKLIGRWTDRQGREWFEAENSKYHARGYVLTRGLEAWIVYSGYRVAHSPDPEEIAVSQRSAATISPKS